MNKEYRTARFSQGLDFPLRLRPAEFMDGRMLELARDVNGPASARGDLPWASRCVRLFPVLDDAGVEVGEFWFAWTSGAWHFGRSAFIRGFERKVNHYHCGRMAVAARDHDWSRLDAWHREALPWFCRSCGRNYAEKCWRIVRRIDDREGASPGHESWRGLCPHGHERVIAG